MRRYNSKQLDRARPNGWSVILMKYWATTEPEEDAYFVVSEDACDGYGEPDSMEFETEAEARSSFEERVNALRNVPNWELQAEYDAMHGTVNGEDPRIAEMRDFWRG